MDELCRNLLPSNPLKADKVLRESLLNLEFQSSSGIHIHERIHIAPKLLMLKGDITVSTRVFSC